MTSDGRNGCAARSTMAEIFDGPPEFTDLTVVNDYTP
jgi:hypothetical protein